MKRAMAHQRGFTLIEVLVALALMALLSIISWQALDLAGRSSDRLNANADDTLALVRVLGQVESDISRHADNTILSFSGSASGSAAASMLLPAGIAWKDQTLTVIRSAHDGTWQQVVWKQDGTALRRAVGPATRALPLPHPAAGEIVLEQIQRFTLRGWVPGRGWSALDTRRPQVAATGLEIGIERRRDGRTERYRKVVLLP